MNRLNFFKTFLKGSLVVATMPLVKHLPKATPKVIPGKLGTFDGVTIVPTMTSTGSSHMIVTYPTQLESLTNGPWDPIEEDEECHHQ